MEPAIDCASVYMHVHTPRGSSPPAGKSLQSTFQSTPPCPSSSRASLAFLKHSEPMNGSGFFVAERGEGCAHVMTRCLDESISAPFFCDRQRGGEGGGGRQRENSRNTRQKDKDNIRDRNDRQTDGQTRKTANTTHGGDLDPRHS